MTKGISNLVMEVNDNAVLTKPNSISFKKGIGETKIRAQSAGGDEIEAVSTKDAETKVSMIKASLLTTNANIKAYENWQAAKEGEIFIRLSDKDGDFTVSFRKMTLVSDNEIPIGADADFEVEFQGPPVA